MLSFYAFAIALLYALAAAWHQTLSNRPQSPKISHAATSSPTREKDAGVPGQQHGPRPNGNRTGS
jgi:hypothetical protein